VKVRELDDETLQSSSTRQRERPMRIPIVSFRCSFYERLKKEPPRKPGQKSAEISGRARRYAHRSNR
jgi:hypothetical protein